MAPHRVYACFSAVVFLLFIFYNLYVRVYLLQPTTKKQKFPTNLVHIQKNNSYQILRYNNAMEKKIVLKKLCDSQSTVYLTFFSLDVFTAKIQIERYTS